MIKKTNVFQNIKKKNAKIFFVALLSVYFLFNIISYNYNKISNLIVAILVLFISLYLVFENRNNPKLILLYLMLTYFNYSIVIDRYLTVSNIEFLNRIRDDYTLGVAINCIFIFMIINLFFSKKQKVLLNKNEFFKKRSNSFIVLTLCSILFYIFLFGIDRGSGLGSGRGGVSTIYEYSVVLFILSYYYCGNKKSLRLVTSFLIIIFILQDLLFGGRVTALQLLIVFYYFILSHRFKWSYCIMVFIFGVILMSTIGIMRGDWSVNINVGEIIKHIIQNKFALDTSTFAFFASLTFIRIESLTSISMKLYLLKQLLLSMIFGGKIVDSDLAEYTNQFIFHAMGGMLPIYLYFYLGWIGSVISGLICGFYTLCSSYKENSIKSSMLIYFVASTPRWYLYSPSALIRGMIIFLICYYFLKIMDKVIYSGLKNIKKNYYN